MQKTQKTARLATLRQLDELGSSVDLSVADREEECAGIEIERTGGICETRIMELSNGLTGYMLDSVVTNQTSRTIYVVELGLRLPWEDARFEWMPDPRELGNSECYRFPGKNPLEFPRDEVINHLVLAREGLQPKRPLRGLLPGDWRTHAKKAPSWAMDRYDAGRYHIRSR